MENSISRQNVNVNVRAVVTDPNVTVQYKTKVLQKNVVNGVNTLTPAMIAETNIKYIIKYDYTLSDNITIPENCVLEFDGGSVSGEHTITGQNTGINAGLVKIFGADVTLAGTWNIAEVYPEWFGAKGDGVTDDTPFILKSFDLNIPVSLSEKIYKLGSQLNISKDICLFSEKGTIIHSPIHCTDCKIVLKGITIKNTVSNAIETNDCETTILNCIFDNIGTENIDPTWQGDAVYNNGGTLIFENNVVSATHGLAAVSILNETTISIRNNRFIACDYRAIGSYQASQSEGIIENNYIADNGKNLAGNSGVGCNGIYAGMLGVVVKNNTILNVVENGIEGAFKAVIGNIIDGTGVDDTKVTPSTSGVYFENIQEGFVFANNIIKNTKLESVAFGSTSGEIKGLRICNNTLLNARSGENIRIVNLDNNSRAINNCVITGNRGDSGVITLIGNLSKQTNIIRDNDCIPYGQAMSYCKNMIEYAKDLEITTFDSESLGTFSINNGTATYQDDTYGKKLVVNWGVYTSIYKQLHRLPSPYSYFINVVFKGRLTFIISSATNPYINGSFEFVSLDDFSEANYIFTISGDYIINISSTDGSTLEIRSITEGIYRNS